MLNLTQDYPLEIQERHFSCPRPETDSARRGINQMDARLPDTAALTRDADVLTLLGAGDCHAAFERLVPRYEHKVYRLCWTLLRHEAQAQDAAQDSLLRVWRALPRFDAQTAALSTWIYAITRNRCLSLLASRPPDHASLSLPEIELAADAVAAPTPDRALDASAALYRCVQALPDAQREALSLYYFEERSVTEVATMLGWPEGTVKTHLHRGRAGVLKQLQALGLAEPSLWL
jgi:RNA polymerase sigma-70 factor (ECF subfamily)